MRLPKSAPSCTSFIVTNRLPHIFPFNILGVKNNLLNVYLVYLFEQYDPPTLKYISIAALWPIVAASRVLTLPKMGFL